MQYLKKHWQGKLSLPVAFWVNFIGGLALLKLIEVAILTGAMTNSPVLSARALLVLYVVTALVLVWQLVGLWRTADGTLLHGHRRGWAVAARFCVALAAGFMVALASQATTTYKELYRIAFVPDPFADYTVQLTDNGKLLHLQGGLGFGVTDAVEQVLERHEDIEGIILDSRGGAHLRGAPTGILDLHRGFRYVFANRLLLGLWHSIYLWRAALSSCGCELSLPSILH
ncbi:hypothetical protein EOE65_02475 [Neptunomonas marina]|uniref:Uncharacterized protein n=1 Tax=Neptunomonas marina TaxID=1815562 RepID=A0A437QDL8_9GAMM|nr:hypothetical protein EOE65_02475 [Neptunomonas marina]